jgi:hypothetical protein
MSRMIELRGKKSKLEDCSSFVFSIVYKNKPFPFVIPSEHETALNRRLSYDKARGMLVQRSFFML